MMLILFGHMWYGIMNIVPISRSIKAIIGCNAIPNEFLRLYSKLSDFEFISVKD